MKYYITLLCLTLFSVHTLSAQKTTKNPFSWERPQGMSFVSTYPALTYKWLVPSKNVFQNQFIFGALMLSKKEGGQVVSYGKRYNFFEYKKLKLSMDANAGFSRLSRTIFEPNTNLESDNTESYNAASNNNTPKSNTVVTSAAEARATVSTENEGKGCVSALAFYETVGLQYILFGKKQEVNMPISGVAFILEYRYAQFLTLKNAPRSYGSFQAGFGLHF
jgi:hypothetical protein